MARGIKLIDTIYEVDNGGIGTPLNIVATMLLRMDAFNLGTDKEKLKKSTTTTPLIAAHVTGNLNIREFGIHPRYLECELDLASANSACYGGTQKRRVTVIVPTLAQFQALKVYDKQKGGTQADTTISINHSFDGKKSSNYRIVKKVDQVLV